MAAHGLVYASTPFWGQAANVFQNWKGSAALLGGAVTGGSLRAVVTGLWAVAGAGFVLMAVGVAFSGPLPWLWRPTAVVGSLFGIASFALFWDGQTSQFAEQGGIGMVICLVVLAAAAAFPRLFP